MRHERPQPVVAEVEQLLVQRRGHVRHHLGRQRSLGQPLVLGPYSGHSTVQSLLEIRSEFRLGELCLVQFEPRNCYRRIPPGGRTHVAAHILGREVLGGGELQSCVQDGQVLGHLLVQKLVLFYHLVAELRDHAILRILGGLLHPLEVVQARAEPLECLQTQARLPAEQGGWGLVVVSLSLLLSLSEHRPAEEASLGVAGRESAHVLGILSQLARHRALPHALPPHGPRLRPSPLLLLLQPLGAVDGPVPAWEELQSAVKVLAQQVLLAPRVEAVPALEVRLLVALRVLLCLFALKRRLKSRELLHLERRLLQTLRGLLLAVRSSSSLPEHPLERDGLCCQALRQHARALRHARVLVLRLRRLLGGGASGLGLLLVSARLNVTVGRRLGLRWLFGWLLAARRGSKSLLLGLLPLLLSPTLRGLLRIHPLEFALLLRLPLPLQEGCFALLLKRAVLLFLLLRLLGLLLAESSELVFGEQRVAVWLVLESTHEGLHHRGLLLTVFLGLLADHRRLGIPRPVVNGNAGLVQRVRNLLLLLFLLLLLRQRRRGYPV
mmetsp:Transcript_47143/g.111144  ORF Transcript_47143/g.111144 Transcript_47143/m.111144 type:complete len:552 (+) Transcript_47143:1057-2712(+)